ncbi:hypothetical protein IFM89_008205 [Coptis chinensis]|uniref:C3H1-type domain-containing protein n=1 Tax=Coptis chinensis TaxID=261450 RepID=A0A835LI52_9MAGN|nr:hypothetical protein IFM89_008205 [Coptis chinensis]
MAKMSSICEEHSYPFYSTKNTLKDIILPPRKLLNKSKHSMEEFPASGCDDYEEESDPYSSDEFRMYEFKIRRCMRSRSHDWTDCPFAHPGEKARRRDPRRFHYSGNACADFRHGTCPRGDSCEFAHGVFECWLHPARYRTHACKDGRNCTRKVCFFAHTPRHLRVLPLSSCSPSSSMSNHLSSCSPSSSMSNHCCYFCHSMASSPTSTLMGLSHLSPPISPKLSSPISPSSNKEGGYSLLSRFNEASILSPNSSFSASTKRSVSEYLSYKCVPMELVNSLQTLDLSSVACPSSGTENLSWGDGVFSPEYEDQLQFCLSPSTLNVPARSRDNFINEDGLNSNGGSTGPDIGWVNELVM